MFPVHIPPNASTLITRAIRWPPTKSKALSVIFTGWLRPATVRFALLKPILPFPFRERGRFSAQFPAMIQLLSEGRGQFQKIFDVEEISLDADPAGLGIQI